MVAAAGRSDEISDGAICVLGPLLELLDLGSELVAEANRGRPVENPADP